MSSLPTPPVPGGTSLPELFEGIYERLKELSSMFMRRQPAGHTLQPTAIVHEAFLKLAEHETKDFESDEHFFATAASVLRSVLVDHARRRCSKKRGSGKRSIGVENFDPTDYAADAVGVLDLEDALQSLSKADARSSRVAELRIFGGMNMDHIARLLSTSVPTAERDWRFARAYLEKEYGLSRIQSEGAST